jgi:hypothetical protein
MGAAEPPRNGAGDGDASGNPVDASRNPVDWGLESDGYVARAAVVGDRERGLVESEMEVSIGRKGRR